MSLVISVAQLSLLHQLYGTVIIPDAVANELKKADTEEREIAELLALSWIRIYQVQNRVLVEERLGRREAKKRGVAVVGVLGILVAAKTEGLIVAIKPILDDLIVRANFWISEQLFSHLKRQLCAVT